MSDQTTTKTADVSRVDSQTPCCAITDFIKGAPAFDAYQEYIVVLKTGDIRRARFSPTFDYANMLFTDCTNPLQNAFCGHETILLHHKA